MSFHQLRTAFTAASTVEAVKKEIGVHFIMPVVKNEKVKEVMLDYDGHHPAQRLTLGEGRESSASTGIQLRVSLKRRS
jgi:hypothetical protein